MDWRSETVVKAMSLAGGYVSTPSPTATAPAVGRAEPGRNSNWPIFTVKAAKSVAAAARSADPATHHGQTRWRVSGPAGGGGGSWSRAPTVPGTLWSSVLTLILLVVLGGGAGLLAVSLVDSRGLSRLVGRLERPSLRLPRRRHTTTATPGAPPAPGPVELVEPAWVDPPAAEDDDAPVVVQAEVIETGAVGEVLAVRAPVSEATARFTPLDAARATGRRAERSRRPDPRPVPAAFTAVEGTYREVARASSGRRLVSLVSLLAIIVVLGVAIAALAGAAIGAAAELVDRTIG